MGKHFDEASVFPIIAEGIEILCDMTGEAWADRDLIVEFLMQYDDQAALIKAPSLHWSDRRLYQNMVDWWSACFTATSTEAIQPYLNAFEQRSVPAPMPGNRARTLRAYRPKR